MKVIIAGSRTFNDFEKLCSVYDYYLKNKKNEPIEIVSGGAKGADLFGERYAELRNYKITRFPAQWNVHGRSAGYIRNEEMSVYADALIAFWDGHSSGTKHMIDISLMKGLEVRIFKYDDNGKEN